MLGLLSGGFLDHDHRRGVIITAIFLMLGGASALGGFSFTEDRAQVVRADTSSTFFIIVEEDNITQDGADTLIDFGNGNSLRLNNVDAATLSDDQFIFVEENTSSDLGQFDMWLA